MRQDLEKFYGFLAIALSITIYGLDIAIMSKTLNRGSIAFSYFNTFVSYSGIYVATIILGFLCIMGLIATVLSDQKWALYIMSFFLVLINIPREAIFYKYFICFNYTYYQVVQARACLTFVSVVVLILINIELVLFKDKDDRVKKMLPSIVSSLILIGIAILNTFILIKLNTKFKKDINDKTIYIGYFTEYEIAQIRQYNFAKDPNYSIRIMGSLYDLKNSQDKKIFSRSCDRTCSNIYLRTFNVEIACSSESVKFYSDCSMAQKIKIQMKYVENGYFGYPYYNCGIFYKNGKCQSGCPGLINHKLYLVQEFNDRVELGWDGFCNCEIKIPNVKLTEDPKLNICDSNGSNLNNNNYFMSMVLILFSSFLFIKSTF
ncbi:unnamed protein product [Brachionus calyciflorus]|uniref:Uncharacterized protein n=1 Tax=Brachionus calyciflorus TaxID=104777 RepID=A0A813X8P2_9BILA|nr:unnamed protein product [Brachionus calyciflorus]